MYAAIRQGKAKAGMAEALAQTIKEGAIPIISDVPGFKAYYVIYERWLGESGQSDKWNPCLIAALMPRSRRKHVETITAEP